MCENITEVLKKCVYSFKSMQFPLGLQSLDSDKAFHTSAVSNFTSQGVKITFSRGSEQGVGLCSLRVRKPFIFAPGDIKLVKVRSPASRFRLCEIVARSSTRFIAACAARQRLCQRVWDFDYTFAPRSMYMHDKMPTRARPPAGYPSSCVFFVCVQRFYRRP